MDFTAFKTLEEAFDQLRRQNERGLKIFNEETPDWKKTLDKGDYCVVVGPDVTAYCECLGEIAQEDEPKTHPMFLWIRAFSPIVPDGEMESTYRSNVTFKISKKMFEQARSMGWPQLV